MDMTDFVGCFLPCSSVVTGDVVLEPPAKRYRSVAVPDSARLASEDVLSSSDDCSASEDTLFGSPEESESGGILLGPVFDDDASTHDEFEGAVFSHRAEGCRDICARTVFPSAGF